ncbi:hypothetical protein SESBI_16022 [Sesbania bispinosa]|nr:hypothetical protein SESBI_16022 [Sesbania bispinosa]
MHRHRNLHKPPLQPPHTELSLPYNYLRDAIPSSTKGSNRKLQRDRTVTTVVGVAAMAVESTRAVGQGPGFHASSLRRISSSERSSKEEALSSIPSYRHHSDITTVSPQVIANIAQVVIDENGPYGHD